MSRKTATVDTPTTITVTDEEGRPFFNGDDMHLPLFLDALDRWTSEHHPTIYGYLENGYIVDR